MLDREMQELEAALTERDAMLLNPDEYFAKGHGAPGKVLLRYLEAHGELIESYRGALGLRSSEDQLLLERKAMYALLASS
jgi:hypothetical protein